MRAFTPQDDPARRGPRIIDRRALGKQLAAWKADLERDLGSSAAQRALVDLAVKIKVVLDSIDAWLLTQPSLVLARKNGVAPRRPRADAALRRTCPLPRAARPGAVGEGRRPRGALAALHAAPRGRLGQETRAGRSERPDRPAACRVRALPLVQPRTGIARRRAREEGSCVVRCKWDTGRMASPTSHEGFQVPSLSPSKSQRFSP